MKKTSLSFIAGMIGGMALAAGSFAAEADPKAGRSGMQQGQKVEQHAQMVEKGAGQAAQQGVIFSADQIVGKNVVSQNGEDLGQIKSVTFDAKSGKIAHVTLSAGGFLGIGETERVVTWDAFRTDHMVPGVDSFVIKGSVDDFKKQLRTQEAVTAEHGMAGFTADQFLGKKVVSSDNRQVGEINSVMVDARSGRIAYVILASGGMLGLGDKHYALPWQLFESEKMRPEAMEVLSVRVDSEKLAKAPGVTGDRADQSFAEDVYEFFGLSPFWQTEGQSGRPMEKDTRMKK
jgi:sporulation protein YlmC with PRC-barrel domain